MEPSADFSADESPDTSLRRLTGNSRAMKGRSPAMSSITSEGRPQVPGRDNRAGMRLTRLALLGHMLRSRSFYERVAFAAIVLAALGKLGQENQARNFARLAAWNKRQVQRLERKAQGAVRSSRSS
jgi:hypothetical protein